jgi:hypothetical protein
MCSLWSPSWAVTFLIEVGFHLGWNDLKNGARSGQHAAAKMTQDGGWR